MGLSDKLHISRHLLPITEKEREMLPPVPEFQTKDLECYMYDVYISDIGRLEIIRWKSVDNEEEEEEDADIQNGHLLFSQTIRLPKEDLNFHGILNFGGFGFEFFAKFTDGNLVEITRDDTPHFHIIALHISKWEE